MDARYSDGQGMSDELILSESMQLLVAGHETSSNALSWLLYLLSSRPDCLDRVRQEFDSVLGESASEFQRRSEVRIYDSGHLEALRLYPPFWMVDRMALADDRAGDVDIPRGSMVIVLCVRCAPCAALLAEPGELRPGALLQSEGEAAHTLHHLPFGADREAVSAEIMRCCRSS
jgi:cytochrome P450